MQSLGACHIYYFLERVLVVHTVNIVLMSYIKDMGLIILDAGVHNLLRELVYRKRKKNSLLRDPPNNEIIFEALKLLAHEEELG